MIFCLTQQKRLFLERQIWNDHSKDFQKFGLFENILIRTWLFYIGSDDNVTGVNIAKVGFHLIWFYCENIDKDLKCARIPSSGSRILTS